MRDSPSLLYADPNIPPEATIHSRAARRAVSPSIDLDKSLKRTARDSASPAREPANAKPHVLAAQNAGITKKSKAKPMKRQQRARQMKAVDRAADNMDKLELKVQKSVGKEKKVKDRRKGWDEVNGEKRKKNAFEILEGGEEKKEREWVSDEEMPEVEVDSGLQADVVGEVKEVVVPESMPQPVSTVEEDELL